MSTPVRATHAVSRGVTEAEARRIGRLAVRALYRELALYPKPGLVSGVDSGAHADMSIATFYRSLVALRGYFPDIAQLGAGRAPWPALKARGVAAEAAMLRATNGINTHRGAIFNLGLVCAAAGSLAAEAISVDAHEVCANVRRMFANAIGRDSLEAPATSHGARMACALGIAGARGEAASGFRSVRTWSLPAYRATMAATGDPERAGVQALLTLIARVGDSNLAWRGGPDGLAWAQRQAACFLEEGGALAPGWRARAIDLHHAFVARRLSPGGSADLLAVTLLLHALEEG